MEIKERIIKLKNEYKLNKLDFEQLRQLYLIKFDVKNDEYIEANYVPYKTGTPKSPENDVGHSKIKTDGPSDFVFTGEKPFSITRNRGAQIASILVTVFLSVFSFTIA